MKIRLSKEYIFMVGAGSLFGLIVFGGQIFSNMGLSVFEISILPYLPAAFMLLPVIIWRKIWRKKAYIWPIVIRGFIEALCTITQFGGLYFHVPVAVIVLLLYTQPLWTIVFGRLFFRERIKRYHIIACTLVLAGIVFLVNPRTSTFTISIIGIVLGLSAGMLLSLRVVAGAWVSRKGIDPYLAKFSETVTSLSFLGIFYVVLLGFVNSPGIMSFSFGQTPTIWLYCIGFALFANVIAHVLYLKGVKKVPIVSAGIIMLLEPIIATILAVIFLHQLLTWYMMLGGILILLGNVFIMIYGQRQVK